MRVYVGQTRAAKWIAKVQEQGWGECTCPSELPPRVWPAFLDNEAFRRGMAASGGAWDPGAFRRAFDPVWWREALARAVRAASMARQSFDFVVSPDIVAGGLESLRLSCAWAEACAATGWPVYLVVQNGMTLEDVLQEAHLFGGFFVGGDKRWKWETAQAWCDLGRQLGKPVHIGRVGTMFRALQARRVGASSIDGTIQLRAERNFDRFVRGLKQALPLAELDLGQTWILPAREERTMKPPPAPGGQRRK